MLEQQVFEDPTTSSWLRWALRAALARDPIDAANDAELLRAVLQRRLARLADGETATP